MKKIVLLLAIMLCMNIIYAQTEKGTIYMSGSSALDLSFSKITSENGEEHDTDVTSFSIMPSLGVFIVDNLVVGLDLMYMHSKFDPEGSGSLKSNSFAIMPMAKYYIPMEDSFRPFVRAGIGWQTETTKNGAEVTDDGIIFGGGIGMAYFIKENISFDLGLDYHYSKLSGDSDHDVKDSTFNIRIGISVFFD